MDTDPKVVKFRCICTKEFEDENECKLHYSKCLEFKKFIEETEEIVKSIKNLKELYPEEFKDISE